MTKTEFDQMIMEVVTKVTDVEIFSRDGKIWYNMNTQMKSGLYITFDEKDNVCRFEARYSEGTIEDFDDLVSEVRNCMCGRDF